MKICAEHLAAFKKHLHVPIHQPFGRLSGTIIDGELIHALIVF
jgi:hypothetical protein